MTPVGILRAILTAVTLISNVAIAASGSAEEALDSYLAAHPIVTRSQSKASVNLAAVKNSILAGNYTSSRPWDLSRASCPDSCTSLGLNASAWPVYNSVNRLDQCDEPMFLSFALYNQIESFSSPVSIRGCAADLGSSSITSGKNTCTVPTNSTSVTRSLELAHGSSGGTVSSEDAVQALEQLLAYENTNMAPCNESINFAYSGQTAVGLYIGSSLHGQGVLASVLEDLIEYIDGDSIPESLFVQLCAGHSSRFALGISINSNGGLPASQSAVRQWRDGECISSSDVGSWKELTFDVPTFSTRHANATRFQASKRALGRKLFPRDTTCTAVQVVANDTSTTLAAECGITAAELTTYNPSANLSVLTVGEYICCTEGSVPDYAPSADSDGNCYSYLVQDGDYCSTLAATYTITVDDINSFNNDTWGWMGCDDLLANEYICLSSGYPPMPAVISNAVCGPQVNGTATAPQGSDLSTLNECPLNACCDIWGQCGITSDFCTKTNSTTGAPGTAANGTNGCISNCGTEIIESDSAPTEFFKIGYFEGYDVERACMRTLITEVDTSAYTHIHMSFATLNADMTFNISTVESQMEDFAALDDVKRIITVGGWDFSTGSNYEIFREAFSESANRASLIDNTIAFLKEWDLDGVDWDWEYPGEPDIPGIPADTDDDATSFFLFLLELEEAMSSEVPEKTISTTAPSSFWYMKAIPIDAIGEVVDYIVLMTYDMHGQWDWNNTNTDPGCPDGGCLRSHVNLTETISALSMITKAGVSSNQVVVGVSSYARSFQMTEAGCYGPNCTFTGPDSGAYPGPCTDTAGYISNAELAAIAEEWDVYSYIDSDSNSNIMVWNDTQWAGYMDDDVKASRLELYESMYFLGTADWAIDLLTDNDSTTDGSACEVYINPSIWDEDEPSVTAIPGCTLIWPPQPLASNTTINFPPWTTNLTYVTTVTATATASSGTDATKVTSHVSQSFPTILYIEPLIIGSIPVWNPVLPNGTASGTLYLTSSVEPSPFTVVWTPIIGGQTVVASPTTTATITKSIFVWGDQTFTEEGGIDILGGSTTVIGGTTLSPTTTTITPAVYPSAVKSTPDPDINTKTTHWKSGKPPSPTASSGCDGCGVPCILFCDSLCPTCETGGDEEGGGGENGGGSDDGGDDDDDKTTTSCATTTTTSNCDVFCTITTSGSSPVTTCTSTECYSVTGCDVTATTATVTDATTAACPAVATGSELMLDGDTFGGCEPCAWHFVPFYDEDDVDDEDSQFWPELAESSFAWPDIDVKRRGLDTMKHPEVTSTGNALPASTVNSGPMVTAPPQYGTYYGGQKNVFEKRKGDRNIISKLGTCVIDAKSYASVPTHTHGDVWSASETNGLIPASQSSMPRWYHSTVSACAPAVTTIAIADLDAAIAAGKYEGKFKPTIDHACEFRAITPKSCAQATNDKVLIEGKSTGEIGWLQDFFDKIFGKATDSFKDVLTCDQMNDIFFGCGTNSLQTVYDALPSDEHFEFVGMSKAMNQRKAKIAKNEWTGTWTKDVSKSGKSKELTGDLIIKSTDPWIGTGDSTKNKQNWGAKQKFETQKDLLWGMVSSCKLVTDKPIFTLMDTTNSRLFNVLTDIDATVSGLSTKLATEFKTYMEDKATMTDTVQGYVKALVEEIEETQLDYVTKIAAQAAADGDATAITDANTMKEAWDALKDAYGLTSTGGAAVCGSALAFTWDTTVKRDLHERDTTSASACTIEITTTSASAATTSSPICVAAQDPDSSTDETWCDCSGSDQKFPVLTGSSGICGYTAFPSSLVTTATNPYPYTFTDSLGDKIGCASETKKVSDGTTAMACAGASTTLSIDYANNPYPYTFTDFYGAVRACESRSYLDVDTVHATYCAGSSTIVYDPTMTVTETVVTSALSKLCQGGSYWECIYDFEMQNLCGGNPRRQMACLNSVISNAGLECEKLCVDVTTTTTMTYTTLAP